MKPRISIFFCPFCAFLPAAVPAHIMLHAPCSLNLSSAPFVRQKTKNRKIMLAIWRMLWYNTNVPRGYSSAGRALEWHSRGQRFDPAYLHQKKRTSARASFSFGDGKKGRSAVRTQGFLLRSKSGAQRRCGAAAKSAVSRRAQPGVSRLSPPKETDVPKEALLKVVAFLGAFVISQSD